MPWLSLITKCEPNHLHFNLLSDVPVSASQRFCRSRWCPICSLVGARILLGRLLASWPYSSGTHVVFTVPNVPICQVHIAHSLCSASLGLLASRIKLPFFWKFEFTLRPGVFLHPHIHCLFPPGLPLSLRQEISSSWREIIGIPNAYVHFARSCPCLFEITKYVAKSAWRNEINISRTYMAARYLWKRKFYGTFGFRLAPRSYSSSPQHRKSA